jgi:glycosyltransferase involved in cell wall biosynthesis
MTATSSALARESRRIVFDGLNLSLAQGTGIATYTRMLTRAAHDLGHEVGIVYSTSFNPAKDALLREISFFDEKRPSMSGKRKLTVRRILNHVVDQMRYHLPVKPLPVELSGAVVARQFKRTLASHDRVYVARNLFSNARSYFSRTKSFVTLAFEPRPDILHCTYPLPLRVESACNVYTIHDLVPLRLPFTTEDNKRQLFRLLKKIANEADHIITVSENSKRDIIELLGVEEKRISNTYQTAEFPREWIERPASAVASQLEGQFGLGFNEYLLFYGAVEPKKNVRRLIEAYFGSRADLPLVLVIAGGWQNDAEIRLLAEQDEWEGVRKRCGRGIHRLDYVSFATLATLIRGARAVIFPSLYEGFGLPVLEAMILGTPVVASREAALPEVAGDAALLVDPYDTDQIARAITAIVGDADLRAELARRGPSQASKFSVERYRERVGEVYAALR